MAIIFSMLSQRLKPVASGLMQLKKWPGAIPKITLRSIPKTCIRKSGNYVPRNQYDVPLPPMLNKIFYMMVNHYEVTPLIIIVALDIVMTICFIFYFIYNKTDVVYFGEWRDYISRTMNLRTPTIHKLYPITLDNYKPWCEMQKILDRMAFAEFMKRTTLCTSLLGAK